LIVTHSDCSRDHTRFPDHPFGVGLVFVAPLHCATVCGARKESLGHLWPHDFAGFARSRSLQPWRSNHALTFVSKWTQNGPYEKESCGAGGVDSHPSQSGEGWGTHGMGELQKSQKGGPTRVTFRSGDI